MTGIVTSHNIDVSSGDTLYAICMHYNRRDEITINVTVGGGGKLQMLFIFVDKPFDEINLFECQLNGVQMLRLAGNVGCPELRTDAKAIRSP
jgi:hypothetical protein